MYYNICLFSPTPKKSRKKNNSRNCYLTLQIPYSLSYLFYQTMGKKGIRSIYGLSGVNSLQILEKAEKEINELLTFGEDKNLTEVQKILNMMIGYINAHPKATWDGD